MKIDLAIKFGSHEIIIYCKGIGIIAKEPAYLAVTPVGRRMKVKAVGSVAEKMQAHKSSNTLVYQPIKNSVIVDEKLAIVLIKEILENKVIDKFKVNKISALVAVPCGLKIEDLCKLKRVLLSSGISKVNFVTNAVCVREYDECLDAYANNCVVDIGKYTTDISILSKIAFVKGRDYFIGGANMDEALKTYVQDNYNLEITDKTAEQIKCKIASLYANDMYSTDFDGITENKVFKTQSITANEVRVAILSVYDKICDLILNYIKELPKELSAEVFANGVIFSGGSANIQGLYEYATKRLDMPVIALDNPVDAVVLGCAKLLDKPIKSVIKIEL